MRGSRKKRSSEVLKQDLVYDYPVRGDAPRPAEPPLVICRSLRYRAPDDGLSVAFCRPDRRTSVLERVEPLQHVPFVTVVVRPQDRPARASELEPVDLGGRYEHGPVQGVTPRVVALHHPVLPHGDVGLGDFAPPYIVQAHGYFNTSLTRPSTTSVLNSSACFFRIHERKIFDPSSVRTLSPFMMPTFRMLLYGSGVIAIANFSFRFMSLNLLVFVDISSRVPSPSLPPNEFNESFLRRTSHPSG